MSGDRIDWSCHGYKFVIEIDGNCHSVWNIDYYRKRQQWIEQCLCCELIRIDPDKEDFGIFDAISEIYRHIKQYINEKLWQVKNQWNC